MDRLEFEEIINDIKVSFLMEKLKLSDKVVSNIKDMYVNNNNLAERNFAMKRRRVVRYEFKRK